MWSTGRSLSVSSGASVGAGTGVEAGAGVAVGDGEGAGAAGAAAARPVRAALGLMPTLPCRTKGETLSRPPALVKTAAPRVGRSARRDHQDLGRLARAVLPAAWRVGGKGHGVARPHRVLLVRERQRDFALEDERELVARLGVGMVPALPARPEDRDHRLQLVARPHGSERLDVGVGPGAV